ncbi:MAG TPA: septum formation family protein [Jiangellaceae bacterium]|nr:septum formation family protein [Jiangellaceae bacterium]
MTGDQTPPAGWYPDEGVDAPAGQQRYWDGSAWTERTTAPTGPAYQAAVPQAPRNGLGIAALILGIVGVVIGIIPFFFWVAGILGVIGLILGFVGRGRAKRGEATNGTMALWGIITSAVAVVVSIVGLVILIAFADLSVEFWAGPEDTASPAAENTGSPDETSAPTQAQETAAPGAGEVDVLDLKVGDCLAESVPGGGEEVSSVQSVPCSEPHSEEVYAAVTLPEGDFPGEEAVVAQAEELCTAEFESFVGLPYEESALYLSYLTPTEESWSHGDREVVCTVYDPDGDTTGTLADANR